MEMNQIRLKRLRETFTQLQNKKILMYGTGVIAHRLALALEGFQIVGYLDRNKVEGDIEGVPIITWDDVEDGTADVLVIASAVLNYREIYDRIIYRCVSLHLKVYGGDGENLQDRFSFMPVTPETADYYLKNETELRKAIEEHDAVSFDLFDTLIMRKTLEPFDVFDMVEERLKGKEIVIPQFRKKRQVAEHRTPNGNIYQIYETLGKMLGLDRTVTETILREEIQCEKDILIPRTVVTELFQYAVSLGKAVNILTDMYLPAPVLEDILSALGIKGYRDIYVSCDYGTGKADGLFPIYLKSVHGLRCLHIGDNRTADIVPAARHGIDTYYIKSAYEMVKISNLRRVLLYENNKCDRLWIGLLISELFNDPFALYRSAGVMAVKDVKMLGKLFIAPIVLVYMQKLYDVLKTQDYDGILFGARDGYLFKRIYDDGIIEPPLIPSFYLLISRRLAFRAATRTEQDITDLKEYLHVSVGEKAASEEAVKNLFCDIFGDQALTGSEEQHSLNHEFIIEEAKKTRRNYLAYLRNNNIDLNGRYLFCDLVTSGTCHQAISRIFNKTQDGLYLSLRIIDTNHIEADKVPHQLVYNRQEWGQLPPAAVNFLEAVITAPMPPVYNMGEGGTPSYALDSRGQETLHYINAVQDGIIDSIHEYFRICRTGKVISKEIARDLLDMVWDASFKEVADTINQVKLMDNMIGGNIGIQ